MKAGIVDYGMGNLGSVKRKMDLLGYDAVISSDSRELKKSDKLILPGVGHFKTAVHRLKSIGLWDFLNEEALGRSKPMLGICLGQQLMCSHSEEGHEEGLAWFDARVERFRINDMKNIQIPHMGWNTLQKVKDSILLKNIPADAEFYFVHAYHVLSGNEDEIVALTHYGADFVSVLQKGNLFGVQFHPEKSHDAGMRMIDNFMKS